MPAPTDTRLPTKPEVQRANTLARLADQIGAELKAAREAAMTSLQHAIKAGELLIQAKAAIGHGNYEHWLRTNLGISKQTAAGYVRCSRTATRSRTACRSGTRSRRSPSPGRLAWALRPSRQLILPRPKDKYLPQPNS